MKHLPWLAVLPAVIILLLSVCGPAAALVPTAGGGWSWLYPQPQGRSLCAVDFVDNQHGWAAGGGSILFSADGGATWQAQVTYSAVDFVALSFPDAQHGWALGRRWSDWSQTVLVATGDGGESWHLCASPNGNVRDVDFVSGQLGFIAGDEGMLYRTVDGGQTWSKRTVEQAVSIASVDMVDELVGWAVGTNVTAGGPAVLRTTDGGQSWQGKNPGFLGYGGYTTVQGLDAQTVLVGGWTGQTGVEVATLRRTDDGGQSWGDASGWTSVFSGARRSWVIAASFSDSNTGWAIIAGEENSPGPMDTTKSSCRGVVLATADSGDTWTNQTPPQGLVLVNGGAVDSDSSSRCWFTGSDATAIHPSITRTGDGGQSWVTAGLGWGVANFAYGWSPTGLSRLAVVGGNDIWAVGWLPEGLGGICTNDVVHSDDGGLTWKRQEAIPSSLNWPPTDVAFVDSLHGWAVGDANGHPAISATTNGGDTWTPQTPLQVPGGGRLSAVDFVDVNNGWAVGDYILHTSDGGGFWSQQSIPPGAQGGFTSVDCVDADSCWITSGSGAALETSDGGATWTARDIAAAKGHDLLAQSWCDPMHGWMVGEDSTIVRTQNGGATWTAQAAFPFDLRLTSVSFADPMNGWTSSESGPLLHTTDGGLTWTVQGVALGASDIEATTATDAFLCTGASILSTRTGGASPQDSTAPSLALQKPSGTWFNHQVTVAFRAADATGLYGIFCDVDREGTTSGDSCTVGPSLGEGLHVVTAEAVDSAGNGSQVKAVQVGIDTRKPTKSLPLNHPSVSRGGTVTLKYRITDPAPGCGKAKATLLIGTRTRLVKKMSIGTVATNKTISYRYRCGLGSGTYFWLVTAKDIAGNAIATKNIWAWTLTVR
jgi:photosystem II stability/assembly factor-like uncharacterized protein